MIRTLLEDRDTFVARARNRLLAEPEPRRRYGDAVLGDHNLPGFDPEPERIAGAKDAAVLVPVIFRPEGGRVLLTERAGHLRKHSGQVAFPGGRADEGEAPLETALREAEEEIALDRRFIQPLGYLPSYYTRTEYRITPIVGLVDAAASTTANPDEVERVFETPFSVLFDMDRYRLDSMMWEGRRRSYYVLDYPDAYIWGVTAALIRILYERLSQT